ncbi:MAG: 4-alpha-glucanotransferase [Clostridia bacterium]
MQRSSGILMHISSLPSPYGIGTFGRAAYEFVDFLKRAKQRYWQVLPLGPTSFGDSPYQSFSAVAGNPYFVDLDQLIEQGLLKSEDVADRDWGNEPGCVNYGKIFQSRFAVLEHAFDAFRQNDVRMDALTGYARQNGDWLEDYALFMALKDANGGRPWTEWPEDIRLRKPDAVDRCRMKYAQRMSFYRFIQYTFSMQFLALKTYANEQGVQIIGDLPIYVPLDSADVWAAPEEFQLDESRRPLAVAGVPPDYFSADGQLWGNPLYDWGHMRDTGYAWWRRRMQAASELFDVIRIDHFRGLSSFWRVPVDEITARNGEWITGPGLHLIDVLKQQFRHLQIIAEDLGFLTDDVRALVDASGYPGMKVLQFAFDAREPSNYLPHTYPRHCVCYTGTHDNTTAVGWFSEAAEEDIAVAVRYLGLNAEEGYHWGLIRGGMGSVADLFIAQLQDYLGLDATARMNTPGTLGGNNWRWRLQPGQLNDALAARIAQMCRIYGRM